MEDVKLVNNYFLTAGYKIPFAWDYVFTPSAMLSYINENHVSIDLNSTLRYKNLALLGVSYRYMKAASVFAEVFINDRLEIGYLCDF